MARSSVRFVPSSAGFAELRNRGSVQQLCYEKAMGAASAAQAGATFRNARYGADVRAGRTRCHARAFTKSAGAYWNEYRGSRGLTRSI